jgi:ADP-dependent phosphofructokinase/glucokinase
VPEVEKDLPGLQDLTHVQEVLEFGAIADQRIRRVIWRRILTQKVTITE